MPVATPGHALFTLARGGMWSNVEALEEQWPPRSERGRGGRRHDGRLRPLPRYLHAASGRQGPADPARQVPGTARTRSGGDPRSGACLLYTSDAADDLLCVDLGGRRIITKKNK